MYHYKESGLSNVYLNNGYKSEEFDGQEFVSIEDVHGLHRAIARTIVSKQGLIGKAEFRFIRVELNLSQANLGKLLGVDSQTVARWEKGSTSLPNMADATIRALYLESLREDSHIGSLLEMISDQATEVESQEIYFEEIDNTWSVAA